MRDRQTEKEETEMEKTQTDRQTGRQAEGAEYARKGPS